MRPNQITIITGHLGKDSVIRDVQNKKVVEFEVAVTNSYTETSSGESVSKTTWYMVEIFFNKKKAITIPDFLKKGSLIQAMGKIRANAYLNKKQDPVAKLILTVEPGNISLLN